MKVMPILMILLSFILIACGGDDKKKSHTQGFSIDPLAPSTVDGLFNPQTQTFEVSGVSYRVQTGPGYQNPQMNPASQVQDNGVMKFRMRVVGYLFNQCQQYQQMQQQYQQCLNQQAQYPSGQQQQLIVLSAQYI